MGSKVKKAVRELQEFIAEIGYHSTYERTGRHAKIHFGPKGGPTRFVILSTTTNYDTTGLQMKKADIKRELHHLPPPAREVPQPIVKSTIHVEEPKPVSQPQAVVVPALPGSPALSVQQSFVIELFTFGRGNLCLQVERSLLDRLGGMTRATAHLTDHRKLRIDFSQVDGVLPGGSKNDSKTCWRFHPGNGSVDFAYGIFKSKQTGRLVALLEPGKLITLRPLPDVVLTPVPIHVKDKPAQDQGNAIASEALTILNNWLRAHPNAAINVKDNQISISQRIVQDIKL